LEPGIGWRWRPEALDDAGLDRIRNALGWVRN
jgi:hypothetical protein